MRVRINHMSTWNLPIDFYDVYIDLYRTYILNFRVNVYNNVNGYMCKTKSDDFVLLK